MSLTNSIRQAVKRFIFPEYATYQGFGYDNRFEPPKDEQRTSYRGAFFRCVEIRSSMKADAMQKAKVVRVIGQDEYEEVEADHPWYKLLRKPNPTQTAYETYWWISTSMDLVGQANHIVLDVNGFGQPVSLLPIYPEFGQLRPVPDKYGTIVGWVLMPTAGQLSRMSVDQVVNVQRPSPFTSLETMSLIQAAIFELDTDKYMKMYRRDSVKDGGIGADIFKTDQQINKDEREKLAQDLKKFKGQRSLDKILVASHGLEPYQTEKTMKDLQFIDGLVKNDEQLKYITGVPVPLFGNAANRSVVEAAEREMIQYTIMPEMNLMCQQLTESFRRIFGAGEDLIIKPPDLKPLDEELEIRKRESYLRTGQRVINEYRKEDGVEPFDGGDTPLIQMGLQPLTEATTLNDEFRSMPQKREVDKYERAWREIDDEKKRLESSAAMTVRDLFDDMQRHVNEKMSQRADGISVEGIFDLQAIYRLVRRYLGPEHATAMRQGFRRGSMNAQATGLEFSMSDPSVQQTLAELAENTKNIADTTRKHLADFVQKELIDMEDTDSVMARIGEFFRDEKEARVGTIAQTMTNTGYEAGQQVAYESAGVTQKRWLSQRDNAVRDSHRAADGQVVSLDERFEVGTARLRMPGDPESDNPSETINCRCSTLPVL